MPKTQNPGLLTKQLAMKTFSAFVRDIVRYTEAPLREEECNRNKQWLREVAAATAMIPDNDLPGYRILTRCEAFYDTYDKWNFPEKDAAYRFKYQKKLLSNANKLISTFRKRTALLEQEVDINLYRAIYGAPSQAIEAIPHVLTEVAKVIAKFPEK